MADPQNPFLPDKGDTLAMMLMGLGSGIAGAGARNQPFYMGIAPGVQDYAQSNLAMRDRAAQYDLARKNYELQNSYKQQQERMIDLQAKGLERQYGMQDAVMKMLPGLMGGQSSGVDQMPPGIRLPQAPLMGPPAATPGAAQTGTDESGGGYNTPNAMGSGAYGKYQFMPDTWATTAGAHPELKLPFDMRTATPDQQEAAKTALDGDNAKGLRTFGIQPSAPNLYLAHRFGVQGAASFLSAPDNAPVASVMPAQWVRQNPDMQGVTVGQFKQGVAQRYGGAPGQPQIPGPPPDATRYAPLSMVPMLAPLGSALAARDAAQYGYNWKRYGAEVDQTKNAREGANQPVTIGPDGQPVLNPLVPQAAGAKAAAEETAKAAAHSALVLPAGWQNMSEKDLRAQMNPLVMASIDQLGKYEKFPSQIPARLAGTTGPTKDEIMSIVPVFHPGWSPVAAANREAFVNFMQPDKEGGKTLGAIGNAAQHLTEAAEAFNEMRNGKIPRANSLFNRLKTENGWGNEVSFDTVKEAIGTEVAKAIAGAGDTGISEREAHRELMAASSSPEQMQKVLARYAGLFGKRLNTTYSQAKNVGLEPDWIDARVGEEGIKALKSLPTSIKPEGASAQRPEMPKPGFVSKGYRFIGGDPGQRINWERVQ